MALYNLQWLIYHKNLTNQPNKQTNKHIKILSVWCIKVEKYVGFL